MREKYAVNRQKEKEKQLRRQIREAGADILESVNFQLTREHIQHGTVTVHAHCINVAKHSLMLADKLKIRVRHRELIRGALLHDYFLYDWHDKEHINPFKLHGFFHPGRALRNATRDFELTEREQDIIRKHMWPMTIVPPKCREAWIVTAADKWVSLLETLRIHK
ncbi:MAG: HD domain-containing protein [Lachnospiraceae bacterium]|nr:HD domain-containing protein [Lachnospiraceae bacterium]MBR6666607.1 HD domain-containing protein [Lachnospiraceae bacterium]